jgi:hypothetical protein
MLGMSWVAEQLLASEGPSSWEFVVTWFGIAWLSFVIYNVNVVLIIIYSHAPLGKEHAGQTRRNLNIRYITKATSDIKTQIRLFSTHIKNLLSRERIKHIVSIQNGQKGRCLKFLPISNLYKSEQEFVPEQHLRTSVQHHTGRTHWP